MIRPLSLAEIVSSSPRMMPAFSAAGAISFRMSPTRSISSGVWRACFPKKGSSTTLTPSAFAAGTESATHRCPSGSDFGPFLWRPSRQTEARGRATFFDSARKRCWSAGSDRGRAFSPTPRLTWTPSKPICFASAIDSTLPSCFRFQSGAPTLNFAPVAAIAARSHSTREAAIPPRPTAPAAMNFRRVRLIARPPVRGADCMISREGESMRRFWGRTSAPAALVVVAVDVPVAAGRAAGAPEKTASGIVVGIGDAWLALEVCGADVVRVAYAKDRAFFARPSLAAEPKRCPAARFDIETTDAAATLATAKLKARVDLATGTVTFLDPAGATILAEKAGGRRLDPAEVQGEKTFHVRQEWEPIADESLYGLGQHQLGLLDIKGYDLDLWQRNTVVVVPFLVSSRGYGILWDNTSFTRFGDLREAQPIPPARLFDASGKPGGLTASYYAGSRFERLVATRVDARIDVAIPGGAPGANHRIHPDLPPGDVSVRWEGAVEAEPAGDYTFDTFSNCGIKLWIDDR